MNVKDLKQTIILFGQINLSPSQSVCENFKVGKARITLKKAP